MSVPFWSAFSRLLSDLGHIHPQLLNCCDKWQRNPSTFSEAEAIALIKTIARLRKAIAECEAAFLASLIESEDC